MQQIGNTSPTWWKPVMRVLLVSALLFVSACTAPHRSSSPPSVPTQRSERPAPDRLLTRGDTQVAEAHVQDIGCDSGPVDGSFTAQTQAAVRAFWARDGLPVSGLFDRTTRLELLPGADQDEFEPWPFEPPHPDRGRSIAPFFTPVQGRCGWDEEGPCPAEELPTAPHVKRNGMQACWL